MWSGTKVYIGNQLCGTVGPNTDEGEWWRNPAYSGDYYPEVDVRCPKPLIGKDVKLEFPQQ